MNNNIKRCDYCTKKEEGKYLFKTKSGKLACKRCKDEIDWLLGMKDK